MSLALLGATTAQPAPAFMRFLPLIVLATAYLVWFITIRTSSGTELDFVRRAIAGRYVPPTAGPQTNEPQES